MRLLIQNGSPMCLHYLFSLPYLNDVNQSKFVHFAAGGLFEHWLGVHRYLHKWWFCCILKICTDGSLEWVTTKLFNFCGHRLFFSPAKLWKWFHLLSSCKKSALSHKHSEFFSRCLLFLSDLVLRCGEREQMLLALATLALFWPLLSHLFCLPKPEQAGISVRSGGCKPAPV